MRIKLFFLCTLILVFSACKKDENLQKAPHDVTKPAQSDRKPNGGFIRFTLDERPMHDAFFEAQFTPRGDVFEFDNLQLYNYNLGSKKYPQIIISINYKQSDLKKWQGHKFSLQNFTFTAAEGTPSMTAKGEIEIKSVSDRFIEGMFSGELLHPQKDASFPIRGEFKASVKVNI